MEEVDLEDLPNLEDEALTDGFEANAWMKMLKREGIFFSDPLDLDFAMLAVFPVAYQYPHPGGIGPHREPDAIQGKKSVTLKTGGLPGLYSENWDDCFVWYPYLFLNRSKPESHLAALNRLSPERLATHAPVELRALIDHVKEALAIGNGDG